MFRFFLLNAPSTTAGDVIGKWDGIGKYIVLYSIIKLLLKNVLQKKIYLPIPSHFPMTSPAVVDGAFRRKNLNINLSKCILTGK
jgi:hypothetical protein